MCAQAAPQQKNKKNNKKKQQPLVFNFAELDDKFLQVKGKALRNLRKRFDKYRVLEKSKKEEGVQLDAQQLQQIAQLPEIEAEMNELEELCRLYIESNPDYDNKNQKQALTEEDIRKAVAGSVSLVANVNNLNAIILEDSSFVEASDAERASLKAVVDTFAAMNEQAASGTAAFQDDQASSAFISTFSKLAAGDSDSVIEDGVSFADLKSLVERCYFDKSQILQRIQDKALAEQRAKQAAEEEAARQAAAEQQRQLEAKRAAEEEERKQKAAQEAAAAAEQEKLDKEKADAEAAKEEPKEQPEVAQAEAQPKDQEEGQGAQDDSQPAQRGRGGRGERRGGRGGRGDYDGERGGRRQDGERRGGRGRGGGYRGNRGNYHRGQREDEDGFITETGEKPKPRRDYRRGGRGEYRGDRGGDRGGYRGDGYDKRGDRGGRGGNRGGRPQTAQQQDQPRAEAAGAQQEESK